MKQRSFLSLALYAAIILTIAGVLSLAGGYFYVSRTLPKVDTLSDYRPPVVTQVYSDDGSVIAEFYRERRIPVPVEHIPKLLIHAFLAAEDSNFYQHRGIDFISIVRAALKNIKAGGIVQGGSTITQQVAKSMLLSPEKKFSRKFKEAILAWRMENSLSKDNILYLYLNQIYLGHGAYGVQAAAEGYFDKNVDELSLAECAMLAGLPQAPSRYSPYRHFAKAKERQKYVIGRMVVEGVITQQQADAALAEELTIHPRINKHIGEASYFTEQVRRYLEANFGEETLYSQGLQVHTSMSLPMQQAAQQSVQSNLRDLDKRHGYRGPLSSLSPEEEKIFLAGQQEQFQRRPPAAGDYLQGVVGGTRDGGVLVHLGGQTGIIPPDQSRWAGAVKVVERNQKSFGNSEKSSFTQLPQGSLIEVRVVSTEVAKPLKLALEQEPESEGALIALDPHSGLVRAMVGGFDFARSQFNRALQAKRLPGSSIKPIIYAAALDKGFTPASIFLDAPIIYKEKNSDGEDTEWKPKNYTDEFYGPTPVRKALTNSYNIITIKILENIGVGYAATYARKLGIVSPLQRDLTLALGSSAVTPMEMATAYSVFASGGVRHTPSYITRILDRDGRVLQSINPADFPSGLSADQKLIKQEAERVISPETAYLITNLMESVVRDGTGKRARALGRPAAGKTGTTNDLKDAWFVGYIPQLVAVSWVGYDQERPLGRGETGGKAAAPTWVDFMQTAIKGFEPENFPVPDDIVFRPIDPETGLLAPEDSPSMVIEAFAPGTEPTRYALEEGQPKAKDFFRMDMESQ